jgi:LacI family transcriptional regulator
MQVGDAGGQAGCVLPAIDDVLGQHDSPEGTAGEAEDESDHQEGEYSAFPRIGDCQSITIDNVGGARAMARHFVEHGFRRILFIGGPEHHVDSTDRLYGFRLGLSERGRDPASVDAAFGDFSTPSGFNAMRGSFPDGRYEAIFAANDRMALGAILYLRQAGLRVPEDVAVAGFDDVFFTEYVTPPLTTVRQPFRELGVTAMETLNRLLAGAPAQTRHVILPASLVVRASCGCRYAEHNPPIPEDRLVLS